MAQQLRAGKLGRVAAGQAHYGHEGPDWSAFFYERGGGSMPDLAVYNLTTLTGLLGPAKHVSAMLSVVTKTRQVRDKGEIAVEAEDNAMILMDHGDGVISHVQSGFNYFNPHGHDGSKESRYTVTVVGSGGFWGLSGMTGHRWRSTWRHTIHRKSRVMPPMRKATSGSRGCFSRRIAGHRSRIARPPRTCFACAGNHHGGSPIAADGVRVPIVSTFPWPVLGT